MHEGSHVGPPDRPDHYRLLKRLGAGGEGEVWKAREVLPGNNPVDLAIKICHGPVSPTDERRWRDRGSLLRNLPPMPGLVRVNEVFVGAPPHHDPALRTDWPGEPPDHEPAGRYGYVVMQYVVGSSLEQRLELPVDRRLRALQPVAVALDQLHLGITARGDGVPRRLPIVHGDVKPSNVVLDANDLGVLVDLGSTTLLAERHPTGRTLLYAAPELVAGAPATPDTDRYSFAAAVAHVVLGHRPAGAPALDIAALDRELAADPLVSGVPRLRQLLVQSLTAPPTERPRSLDRWLAEVRRLVPTGPDATVAPAQPHQTVRRRRLSGRRTVVTSLGVSAGVVAAALVFVLNDRQPASPRSLPEPTTTASPTPTATISPSPVVSAPSSAPPSVPSSGSSPTRSRPPQQLPPTTSTRATDQPRADKVTVSATIGCAPASCTTSEFTIPLNGSFRGSLADGHQLMLFTYGPDGRYYAGSQGMPSGGRWSGAVHVGSKNGTESTYRYPTCVYDTDAAFRAHMASLGESANNGVDPFPTAGSATSLGCTTVTWNRP